MLRTLTSFIPKFKIAKNVRMNSLQAYSTAVAKNSEGNDTNAEYSPIEETKILKIINKSGTAKLKKYAIEISNVKKIISNRNAAGVYTSLDDVISRNEFEASVLEKFFNSIIHGKVKPRIVITPSIQYLEIPDTTLGLHVGPNLISWALVNKDFGVLNWDYISWYDPSVRTTSYDIIKMVRRVIKDIPESSAYVMEDIKSTKHKGVRNILNIQQQLTISIIACLSIRQQTNVPLLNNTVYILNSGSSARFFNLCLGSEIISTTYAMNMLQDGIIKIDDINKINVNMNSKMKLNYMGSTGNDQQQMSWSLLKALTFLYTVTNK